MEILICDENEDYIDELMNEIKKIPCDEDIYFQSFTSIKSALYRLRFDNFDMAIINSVINGESAIELGKKIKEKHPDCLLYYNAESYAYIHDMFRINTFQYLPKGDMKYMREQFLRGVSVYKKNHLQLYFITSDFEKYSFIPSEIIYIETGLVPCKVVTTHGAYLGEFESMGQMKKLLNKHNFFQVHQSFFVNFEHLVCLRKGELEMANGDIVPTSTYNRVFVDEAIRRFLNAY